MPTAKRLLATQQFLVPRLAKKECIGALVCGSYVTGNPSAHSDIDLHILLANGTPRRERGNKVLDGYMIEYFANTTEHHHHYFAKDFLENKKYNAHMFATGTILSDPQGEVKKLCSLAHKRIQKPYTTYTKEERELKKYLLRDAMDNFLEVVARNECDIEFVYHQTLYQIYTTYARYVQADIVAPHKLLRLLTQSAEQKKYMIQAFPDDAFGEALCNALMGGKKKIMVNTLRTLTQYVLDSMGGFAIDGWKVRTKQP